MREKDRGALRKEAYEEEEPECVIESVHALRFLVDTLDLEASRSEDDGESKPEAAIGGQSSGAEGIANSHFPVDGRGQQMKSPNIASSIAFSIRELRILITYHMPASNCTSPP